MCCRIAGCLAWHILWVVLVTLPPHFVLVYADLGVLADVLGLWSMQWIYCCALLCDSSFQHVYRRDPLPSFGRAADTMWAAPIHDVVL